MLLLEYHILLERLFTVLESLNLNISMYMTLLTEYDSYLAGTLYTVFTV